MMRRIAPPEFEPHAASNISIETHAVDNGFTVNVALAHDRSNPYAAHGGTFVARNERELRALLTAQATARIDEVMAHFKAAKAKKTEGRT